jgi:hypothetical protein
MFRKTLGVLKLRYNLVIALDQWIRFNTYPLQKKKKAVEEKPVDFRAVCGHFELGFSLQMCLIFTIFFLVTILYWIRCVL